MKSTASDYHYDMSYFSGYSMEEVKRLEGSDDDRFNHSLCALRMARMANGVSQLHGVVSRAMWNKYPESVKSLLLLMLRNLNIGLINLYTMQKMKMMPLPSDFRKKYLKKNCSVLLPIKQEIYLILISLRLYGQRRFAGYKKQSFFA